MARSKYFYKVKSKSVLFWSCCEAWLFHFSAALSPVYLHCFSAPCRVNVTPLLLGCELALSKLAWASTSYFIEPCGFTLWACFKRGISVWESLISDECPTLLAIFRLTSLSPFPSSHNVFERSCFLLILNGKILKS